MSTQLSASAVPWLPTWTLGKVMAMCEAGWGLQVTSRE